MERHLEILMLEDDPVEESRLIRELSKHGCSFRVYRVQHQREFVRALDAFKPNLILADLSATGLNGFAALDLAREQHPETPFVFVSSKRDEALLIEILQSGAAGCVYRQRLEELVPLIRQAFQDRESKATPRPESPSEPASARPTPGHPHSPPRPLPLCGRCRLLRNDQGQWVPLEHHLDRHGPAWIGLAICPACASLHWKTN